MRRDSFVLKTQISFGIKSDTVEPDIITKELNIIPSDTSFKKGDTWESKHDGSRRVRNSNIWRLETEFTVLEEETVSHHIKHFMSIFSSKADILTRYKADNRFDVIFLIWIETDNAGVGLDLSEEELSFLNSISNRVHFSIICNREIEAV